jgi:hypothetical protein
MYFSWLDLFDSPRLPQVSGLTAFASRQAVPPFGPRFAGSSAAVATALVQVSSFVFPLISSTPLPDFWLSAERCFVA